MKPLLAAMTLLLMVIMGPASANGRHHRGRRDNAYLKFNVGKTRVELGTRGPDCDRSQYRYQAIPQTHYICSRCRAQYNPGHQCGYNGGGYATPYSERSYQPTMQVGPDGLYYNEQYGAYMRPGESYEQYYMRATGKLPPHSYQQPAYQQSRPVYVQPAPGQPVMVRPPVYSEPVVYGSAPSHHCGRCGGNHSGACR